MNSAYLDTLDIVVESEINHWTSHVQHFFARSAWTHVAMIVRDPPRSVLKAYGLLKYAREMPEHAHLFVFEAVRPSVRLTPLREYMRYKQEISAYKVIGVRKLHMDRKRGINWPELEQFMLDLSTTNFVVGPLAMVKANYQLNADTVDEFASINAVQSATLPTPYARHFLELELPKSLDEGDEFVLDIAAATAGCTGDEVGVAGGGGGELKEVQQLQQQPQQQQLLEEEQKDEMEGKTTHYDAAAAESKNISTRMISVDRFGHGTSGVNSRRQIDFLGWTSSKKKVVGSAGTREGLETTLPSSHGALAGHWDNAIHLIKETTPAGGKKTTAAARILGLAHSKFKRSEETKEEEKRSWLRMLAMRRARKEEDLQDTPGIFCSQVSCHFVLCRYFSSSFLFTFWFF